MNDRFQLLHGAGIMDNAGGEKRAIDFAVRRRTGECGFDRGPRLSFVKPVNCRVGVVNGNSRFREQLRSRRLSHSDRAGQPKNDHVAVAIGYDTREKDLTTRAAALCAKTPAVATAGARGW